MNVNPNSVALFRTQTSSQRSGSTAGDEGLASRLTVLCFCAINIVYGLLGDGDLHLKRGGKKDATDTYTGEFQEITQMLKSFPGAMVFNRSLRDKSLQ